MKRVELDGEVTGVYADYHYVGTGDTGGAAAGIVPRACWKPWSLRARPCCRWRGGRGGGGRAGHHAASRARGASESGRRAAHRHPAAADQMFLDIKPAMTARMPRWKGDLELINHSAGSLTSEAYHKRWNRKNEMLADAAEKASLAAAWLGGRPYPQQRLNDAWTLVMGGQFHDTAAGTATPRSYEFAWNDDVIAMNQFAGVLTNATESVASALDTQAKGTAVVVYNPLNIAREDVVEADGCAARRHKRRPRHRTRRQGGPCTGGRRKVVFRGQGAIGRLCGLRRGAGRRSRAFHLEGDCAPGADAAARGGGADSRAELSLENERYRVTLDNNGDVASIFDKLLDRELLSAPIRLAISNDHPSQWPAWNMDFDQEQAPPRAYVRGGRARINENGPARVTIEVTRTNTEGSHFVQTVSLSAGDAGNRVEFGETVDWKTLYANLKATFPLAASNRGRHLQLGPRHGPPAQRHRAPVRSRFPPVDRPHRPYRRLWRHDPHRLQERLRQAQ